MRGWTGIVVTVGLALVAAVTLAASTSPPAQAGDTPLSFEEVMVPMRDGVRLQTVILAPRDRTSPLPILLQRTPYGVPPAAPSAIPDNLEALHRDGYIFVFQSMRGRFKSEGSFTFSTAVHPGDAKATDESTDAWDTIDWLVTHVPGNNGKVGIFGVSYPGLAAAVALVNPHPALKAASPQAAWTDYWQNDDLHRNGALRLTYAADWLYMLQHEKQDDATFVYDSYDTYAWFLRLGPVQNLDTRYFKGSIPMFTSLVEHPNHDAFYTRQRWVDALGRTTVPTLNVAGYWDQEDPWGSWQIYRTQERSDPDRLNVMVAGPWCHGCWELPGGQLGRIPYGIRSGTQFLEDIQAPFFAYWLHGRGARPEFEVKSFQSGSWQWRNYREWPPGTASPTPLYLRADGALSFSAPTRGEGCRDYVSDPANPVPFRERPISPTYPGPDWQWWEAADQRFVDGRPDVLSYVSAPLEHDLVVTGALSATLRASTSGTDADMVVKVIDVFPDDYERAPRDGSLGAYARSLNGYELPVAMDIRRGRWLSSDTSPEALVPGKVVAWDIPLRDHDHVFLKGHRLMVQVQSSWFPVIDRNPQTFVPNIAKAKPTDFVKATQRVCAGSIVSLPIVK